MKENGSFSALYNKSSENLTQLIKQRRQESDMKNYWLDTKKKKLLSMIIEIGIIGSNLLRSIKFK